jgi:hypothetical protein
MEVTPEALKAMQQLAPEMSDEVDTGEEHGMAGEGKFQETGKTASIRGFECKQYIKKGHDQITMIWASADESGVTDVMTDAMNKMQSLDPENGDRSQDTWNVLKGMIPVEVRSIRTDLDSDVPEIKIRSITKIKKTTPDADMFRIPGPSEGFKQTSMEDYLK